MKAILHVHQQLIRKGEPALIIRTYQGSTHHTRVEINGPSVLVQNDEPDSCGARVWIEADTADLVVDGKAYAAPRRRTKASA